MPTRRRAPSFRRRALWLVLAALSLGGSARAVSPGIVKRGSRSPLLSTATDHGRANPFERHAVVVGLALRDRDGLEAFLADVQNPASPRYRQFLTQAEFNALHAPTEADESAIVAHLEANGLRVTQRFPNRLVIRASGPNAALERSFGVHIHAVERGGRMHYAAIDEPSLPADLAGAVIGVVGLDDLAERHPRVRTAEPAPKPHANLGTHCCALGPD